jgi:hypothetical protein
VSGAGKLSAIAAGRLGATETLVSRDRSGKRVEAYDSVKGVPVMALRTRQPFQIPQEAVQPGSTSGAARTVALRTLRRVLMLVNCIVVNERY